MKYVKVIIIFMLFAVALALPSTLAQKAHAESTGLKCQAAEDLTAEGCDLAVTKQVSVNGGTYVTAETSSAAPQAHVGDTVTWKITITNDSDENLKPVGCVTVNDTLPSGVTYVSSTTTTGSYATGVWTFALNKDLPATLTITTTANTTGVFENTAALATYDQYDCDWTKVNSVTYSDSDPSNNSDNAFVDVVAVVVPPVVTPAKPAIPTVPNTGFGINTTNPLQSLTTFSIGAVSCLGLAFATRRLATKKQ